MAPPTRRGPQGKGGGRRAENNRLYTHPLPLVFSSQLSSAPPSIRSLSSCVSFDKILNPHCEGIFDPITRSVWVTTSKDAMILWRRGFFGKGDLSRSEPSWLSRQINARQAARRGELTSEEIREKRRAERKQFKLDRAKAMADAAAEAEAAFTEGRQAAITVIPSGATWKPQSSTQDTTQPASELLDVDEDDEDSTDLEHLQLTLQEAFFLSWGLGCLTVLDHEKLEPMTLADLWAASQDVYKPIRLVDTQRFDNPFIVQYAVFHYYRSLGWVVKGGLKFCVDLLLYKRGPVFNHAEFAIVVMPVYESEVDQTESPYKLANAQPFSWSWLSTVNRVNSQVQKTLILTYVTIPSRSRLSPSILSSPACLAQYTVQEVVLRRFIPARMRN